MHDERNEVFHKIQEVLAGHSELACANALIGSLVVAFGVSADSLEQAKQRIRRLPDDMIPALIHDWPKFRKHRDKMNLRATIEALEVE